MNVSETRDLGWDWSGWSRGVTTVHYANLTRGVACAPADARLCRIQSSHCEDGSWERLLLAVPDELIAHAALGRFLVVHDYSEKNRETRAMRMGLTLTRMMMEFRWFGELRSRYRGERSMIQYLRNVAARQPRHVRHRFDYHRELLDVNDTTFVRLVSCRAAGGDRRCNYGPVGTGRSGVDLPPANLW